jgi:hypothetical protein
MGINLPHLIVGDVENIPLRNEWAEAVLAFDAFHHIPGRKRAMAELDRIMKPGTRIVMIEPGGGHEDHPRAIAVMKEHGILERGVDPDVLTNDLSGTNLGNITSHPTKDAGLVLLTMEKSGRFQTDSRAPRDLIADLKTVSHEEPIQIEERAAVVFDLLVENAGDTVWLHETPDGDGRIRLGVKLLAEDGSDIKSDYARLRLPRDLAPGQGLVLQIILPPISELGRYIYEFDLVDEGFLWFKDYDYRPYRIPVTIQKSDAPRNIKPDSGSRPPGGFPAQAVELSFYSFRWRMNEPTPNPQPSPTPIRPDTIRAILREDGWAALVKKGFRRLRRAVGRKQP